ncbi:MAG TPA: phospholipase D-like domain-containing protein [Frankiaceae bacterium]|nr:phospholipase D-like domain-containing protein [Frankiaceae bacterium]
MTPPHPRLDDWFLGPDERGNPATEIRPWTTGNLVEPLIHGAEYFPRLFAAVEALEAGDLFVFTDWRGDADEVLVSGSEDQDDERGTVRLADLLGGAAERGVLVRGLVWRSHVDQVGMNEQENQKVGDRANEAGAMVLLDERVRAGGSHHQKLVVLRPADPEQESVAFVGGIDLAHSRRDDASHAGDPQPQPMAAVYGDTPPWHDVQAQVRGPAVADLEYTFRERWNDPTPLDSRNPYRMLLDLRHGVHVRPAHPMPARRPDPPAVGPHAVQVLRTYASRTHLNPWKNRQGAYPFAPDGERSIARGYVKVWRRARRLIYVEDQYLWSIDVARLLARALESSPDLHIVAVVPRYPDQDGRFSLAPNLVGREQAIRLCRSVASDRLTVFDIENPAGTPVYVHAKVSVVDDVWATIGSDNLNRRSWSHDSELNIAVVDETRDERSPRDPGGLGDGARVFARDLRLRLWREHTDGAVSDDELIDPEAGIAALQRSADRLEAWHADGRRGPRPPGRLRPHRPESLSLAQRAWALPLYRAVYDPDGRPRRLRRAGRW